MSEYSTDVIFVISTCRKNHRVLSLQFCMISYGCSMIPKDFEELFKTPSTKIKNMEINMFTIDFITGFQCTKYFDIRRPLLAVVRVSVSFYYLLP